MRFQPSLFVLMAALALPPAPLVAAGGTADADKLICKNQQKTGTRFPRKTCRTQEQWDRTEEEHKRNAAEQINRPMIEIRRD